jgi:pimeloyl-ACP methyl ester carboxylesterase
MIQDVNGESIQISSWQQDPGTALPAVLWLHGAGMDRTIWMIAARDPRLAACTSLAVDLPGHGRSAASGCGSIGAYARFVTDLLDELGIAAVRLVGHSMGALIGLEMLARRPERLTAVVLAGAATTMPVNPALIQAARHDLPRAARMIATYAVSPASRLAAAALPGIRIGGGSVALLANSKAGVLAADLGACDAFACEVQRSPVPALVVTGARDRMVPAKRGRELAAALDAETTEIEGAGHLMMLERPSAFADAVVPFLLHAQAMSRAR